MQAIPIFIINLKKDKAKKQHMQDLCNKQHLQVKFIEAVDGRKLSQTQIKKVYDKQQSIKAINRELTKAEVGCALSHRKVYQKMLTENIQQAVILEDDIVFNQNFKQAMVLALKLPMDWQLLLLGYNAYLNNPKRKEYLYKIQAILHWVISVPLENAEGTYGYLINQTGVKILLTATEKLVMPIDSYTGDYRCIKVYTLSPKVVGIDLTLDSTILENRQRLQQLIPKSLIKQSIKHLLNFFRLSTLSYIIYKKYLKSVKLYYQYYRHKKRPL